MQSDDAIKISAIAGRHTLTIDSCIIDDDGNYVCKAKNPGGQASSRTSVQVTGKFSYIYAKAMVAKFFSCVCLLKIYG